MIHILITLTIFGIFIIFVFGSDIDPIIFLKIVIPVLLITIFIETFSLKDFFITKERIEVRYSVYKSKIVELEFNEIKTLRFDIGDNPKGKPRLTICYIEPHKKEKIIEFAIGFKYKSLVEAIELLRKNGINVIWTENTEVK